MLGRQVNELLKTKPSRYPWGDTLPVFKKADRRFANLECVLADVGQPWSLAPKAFHFRSDIKNIGVLRAAGINAVSLANNHVLDFEFEAMAQTLKVLGQAQISSAGAGNNLKEASNPTFIEGKGAKIGFLAFTDNEPDWEATAGFPGIFYVPTDLSDPRAKRLLAITAEAKKKADFLIVSAHWGPNWGYDPPADHPPFAHALIDSGADVIFGHSAHVFRGIEIYQGKAILYSTGDFVDDYAVDEIERNDESFIFILEIKDNRLAQIDLYPTIIENFQARLARGNQAENIALKMQTLCAERQTPVEWQPRERVLKVSL